MRAGDAKLWLRLRAANLQGVSRPYASALQI
jgi:hypothetical protein